MPLLVNKGQPAHTPTAPPKVTQPVTPKKHSKRSPHSLMHLATRIFNTPLMIRPEKLNAILSVLGPRLGIQLDSIPPVTLDLDPPDDGDTGAGLQNGVAVIPIYGTLVKRSTGMDAMSGMTSYEEIRSQIETAMADPQCKALLFDIDSPGGESAGMFELSDYIYSLRGEKPMVSVANDSMYSAAIGIGSAADECYVTSVGGAGSIGVYMLHTDQSEFDEMRGVKYTYIKSGAHKTEGNPHEPLSDTALAAAQAEVDRQRDMFVDLVARNRGMASQKVFDTEAQCYYGADAVNMGLCNQVGSLDQAMVDVGELAGSTSRSRVSMHVARAAGVSARIFAGAIGPHKTATSDGAWDGPANEARLKSDQSGSYYRKEYAWVDSDKDETKKNAYKFPHHEVSGGGDIGAANVKACQSIIGSLNGARGGSAIPGSERQGVYNHAAKHLKDAGVEPPELKSELESLQVAMGSVYELDPDPLSTILAMRRRSGSDNFDPLAHRYEGSDIELHLRHFAAKIQLQELAGGHQLRTISACIAPYNQLSSDLGGYKEVYEPGCFAECLKQDDPLALFGHDPMHVLGCKSAGTVRFIEKPDGLYFEADPPDTQWVSDLLVSMRRGDIKRSSSAFFILKPRWEYRGSQKIRVIEQAKLVEGSVVSFAAYESTTASVQDQVAAQQEQLAARLRLLSL